ncbi:hypothetical protein ABZ864_40960 [Streptomyces sp. NPDC047082]|uniref:hypothetical protein n=1 Tax=Streptomyces sp. NPDC047082 TaxID=3155259 RepID=UPI0033F85665
MSDLSAAPSGGSSVGDRLDVLRSRLQRLRLHSGQPSFREISRRTHRAISHTTVSAVVRCEKLPKWGQLELIVEVLGGNRAEFRTLWVAVAEGSPTPLTPQRPAYALETQPDLTAARPESDTVLTLQHELEIERQRRRGETFALTYIWRKLMTPTPGWELGIANVEEVPAGFLIGMHHTYELELRLTIQAPGYYVQSTTITEPTPGSKWPTVGDVLPIEITANPRGYAPAGPQGAKIKVLWDLVPESVISDT